MTPKEVDIVKCILLLFFMNKYIILCDVSKLSSKITLESIMKYTYLLTRCIYEIKTTWCFVNVLELPKGCKLDDRNDL